MSTAFITHADCLKHDMGDLHPEAPGRLTAIQDHLIAQGIDMYFTHYDAPLATLEQLMLVHPASHIKKVKDTSPAFGIAHLDPAIQLDHRLNGGLRLDQVKLLRLQRRRVVENRRRHSDRAVIHRPRPWGKEAQTQGKGTQA